MKRPLVTVLMALYNGGEYLKQSIQSVLNQTYRNFEFLIINDCSTDDSLRTIESFQDERIKIYNNETNFGQTKSLNRGLKLAAGQYIARMDGDDVALPRWLERQVEYIAKHPDCSVVSSYAVAIDEKNRVTKLYKPPLDSQEIILRSLIACPIHHVGSVYRIKDVIEIGGYEERYIIASDYALWEKLIKNNFIITTTPEVLVAIREHANSISRSGGRAQDIEETEEIVRKNITTYVGAQFSNDEINLFYRANYEEGDLTAGEFDGAVEMTKKVYMNISLAPKIGSHKLMQWIRHRCEIIYGKRILFLIKTKNYEGVKELSQKAIRDIGPLSVFTAVWWASLFGGMVLSLIPRMYQKMLSFNARIQLAIQPNLNSSTAIISSVQSKWPK